MVGWRRRWSSAVCGLFLVLLGLPLAGTAAAQTDPLVIGAGKANGVYFPVAGAICQVINGAAGPRCTVSPGGGSKANLEALRAKAMDFAVVQSDWQFWAYKGAEFFDEPSPFTALNAVLALHAEPLVIAVRRDSGIATLDDLKGKRVGIGAPATAARGMVEALIGALGWSLSSFAETQELAVREQSEALCGGALDAAAYAAGSPSATLAALTAQCDVAFLAITGPAIDKLLEENPFYRLAEIPGGIYRGVESGVATFGVGATMVTRADVGDASVTMMLAAITDNFDALRQAYPALTWLKIDELARGGLSAPLHPAAARFFDKLGGS